MSFCPVFGSVTSVGVSGSGSVSSGGSVGMPNGFRPVRETLLPVAGAAATGVGAAGVLAAFGGSERSGLLADGPALHPATRRTVARMRACLKVEYSFDFRGRLQRIIQSRLPGPGAGRRRDARSVVTAGHGRSQQVREGPTAKPEERQP